MKKFTKILVIIAMCFIVVFSGCSSNRLANTTWEGIHIESGGTSFIVFGTNSFWLYAGGGITTGSYRISGDLIFLDAGLQGRGSIIGGELVINFFLGTYAFTQVRPEDLWGY